MPLTSGTRIGPYEVLSPLGAGGMGEVYRARDSKLERDVAIKLLPSDLTRDPDRLARLSREARLLAALNHPHIATIYGLEESGGVRALVMEVVEGPTLAEKLAQSSWTQGKSGVLLADALRIASEIAQGLEAAHGKGIIHRDLKPGNIKFSHDGRAKVLDFGLAKAAPGDAAGGDALHLPTITAAELHGGVIVGTPAYMSPEQARGEPLDKRTDIWAFGCVLYEMLAGRAPFPGKTISDTIAAILERDPDWDALPARTPPPIRQLLRRCLDKDPNRRLHDIADARIEIDDVRSGAHAQLPGASPRSRSRVASAAAIALLAAVVTGAAVWALRPVPVAQEARLDITTPPTRDPSVAMSPDGQKVAYIVTAAGQPQLWIRSLDSATPRVLRGTEKATLPFWSPDGKSIGFFAETNLKRTDLDGGTVRTLSSRIGVALGASWNTDGIILFGDNPGGPILRVAATGGEPEPATRVEMPQQRGHALPQFLPDGRHFLFYVTGSAEARGLYLGELGSLTAKRLSNADGSATYSPTGYLLFVRDRKLLAQRFDPVRDEPGGAIFSVDEHLAARTVVSPSTAGHLAYRTGSADSGQRQLVWLDRSGRELDKVVYADSAALGPALSRDGRRLAVYRFADGNMDIWSFDIRRRIWDRLTFDRGDDIFPLWSPDGSSIVFGAVRKTAGVDLYRRALNAPPEKEEPLLGDGVGKFPMDWSPDGRYVLYSTLGPKSVDLWAVALDGDRKPFAVAATDFSEAQGQFSPDGTWIAYQSDKTGRSEIYLRPFPRPGADIRVSTDGGGQPRWNPNGKELFYVADDDRLAAVEIRFSPDHTTVEAGTPVPLFLTNIGSTATLKYRQHYIVSPDGQSFIMHSVVGEPSASPISVILNWKPGR